MMLAVLIPEGNRICSRICTVSVPNCSPAETAKLLSDKHINRFQAKAVLCNESAETAPETAFSYLESVAWSSLAVSVFDHPPTGGVRVRLNGARTPHPGGSAFARGPPTRTRPKTPGRTTAASSAKNQAAVALTTLFPRSGDHHG